MRKCCDEVKVVKEDECVTEAKNAFLSVALIVGILTIIVGICVAVYKYLTPDYLDDFDDYDDDFDDSFFDDDDAEASTYFGRWLQKPAAPELVWQVFLWWCALRCTILNSQK